MEENRKYKRDINEKLCEIRNKLGKVKVGSGNDWDLAASICQLREETLLNVFGSADPVFIFLNYKPDEAKQSLDEYFGRNEEAEEETIKRGDIVDIVLTTQHGPWEYHDCIFVAEDDGFYHAVQRDDRMVSVFIKSNARLRKCRKE